MSENMTDKARAITQYIIAHPGSSQNKIYEGVKSEFERAHAKAESKVHAKNRNAKPQEVRFNRITVLRRVKFLQARALLRVEKGPRNAKLCWLTFRGLMYAIQNDLVDPKDAETIESAHNLKQEITCHRYGGPQATICQDVEEFKKQYPSIFFKVLSMLPNILSANEKDISNLSCFAMFLSSYYRYLTDEKYYLECQETEFAIGCWAIYEPEYGEPPFTFIMETLLKTLGFKLPDPPFYKRSYPEN